MIWILKLMGRLQERHAGSATPIPYSPGLQKSELPQTDPKYSWHPASEGSFWLRSVDAGKASFVADDIRQFAEYGSKHDLGTFNNDIVTPVPQVMSTFKNSAMLNTSHFLLKVA